MTFDNAPVAPALQPERHSWSQHFTATVMLGLPLVGSSLAQMALHVVNTVMVGRLGAVPLAALVIAASSFFILFIMGSGFARAVMPLAAAARATGNESELRRVARMGLWLSVGFGALVYPLFWYSADILMFMHQQPEVALKAQGYLRIVGLGMIPALGVAVLQGWLAALERTGVVLWVTLAAVGVNIAINWFLIYGNGGAPALGVTGAAIASLSVQLFSLILLCLYAGLHPQLRAYRLFRRFFNPDVAALASVFRLGWPIGLTGLAESGLFEASALMMGAIGASELAAHGIALEAAALAFMCHIGLSNAATIRVAGFASTGDARGLRDAALVALAISGAIAAVVIAIFLSVPELVVSAFLDTSREDSAAILAFGVTLLAFAALFQLADAAQVMALGLLRGLQDTRVPMALAAVSYWVIGVPCSYLLAFPMGYGGVGLWLGLVVGLLAAGASLMLRFWLLAPKPAHAGKTPL